VYSALFLDLETEDINKAAQHYVEALRIKDLIDAEPDRATRLTDPRWGEVYQSFLKNAQTLRLDPRWAYHHHAGFQKHKGELDYWTDLMLAERYMLDRILRHSRWREKRSDGRNGPGPLPFLYMVSAECHDLHHPQAAALSLEMMAIYFTVVLDEADAC